MPDNLAKFDNQLNVNSRAKPKIAIVHDWLTNMGGAELVLSVFLEIFPDAHIYTALFEPANLAPNLAKADVRSSFLQRLPRFLRKHQNLLPVMPYAFEQFDLSEYDFVLSSSWSCAKGVITGTKTIHVCYCYTPMRYAWDYYHLYIKSVKGIKRWLAVWFLHRLRLWDRLSADRVDHFVAISHIVQDRISKHYRRESTVVYPPVDTERFVATKRREEFYVVVSRLVEHKRLDLAVQACNRLGRNLVVIGNGVEKKHLMAMDRCGENHVAFLDRQSDQVVNDHLARAKAFLFPGEEDFGITMVEALSSGCPVIAYGRGGAVDIVEDGITGVLFNEQTVEGLMAGILRFEEITNKGHENFEPSFLRSKAEKFSKVNFKQRLTDVLIELGALSKELG